MNAESTQRFDFPGFSLLRQEDTDTHEVEIGQITVNDEVLVVHMLRKKGLPFKADFLVSKVTSGDEKSMIWSFSQHRLIFPVNGPAVLALSSDGEIIIAFIRSGRNGPVEEVLSIAERLAGVPLDIGQVIKLKIDAAAHLDRKYTLTKAEQTLRRHQSAQKREKEEEKRREAFERKRKARMELTARVKKRPKLHVFTNDGQHRQGLPVIDDEWRSLPPGTLVVLVESYDEEERTAGEPIEAFKVVKENGKAPKKGFPMAVSAEGSTPADGCVRVTTSLPMPVDTILIDLGDSGVFDVAVYLSMEEVRRVRSAGLNGGSYVTAREKRGEDGRYEVYSVSKENIDTIGLFVPIS